MVSTLLEVAIAPLLAGAATIAGRRWNPRVGGLVSAFPAVVGPTLLITARQHGALFAQRAAIGTLLGLVGLSGFVVVYGQVALRARWAISLGAAWACAALLATLIAATGAAARLPAGLGAATASLVLAYRTLPAAVPGSTVASQHRLADDIRARMLLTAVLVVLLAIAAGIFGALLGGVLASLPVLASILAVSTHRTEGSAAAIALLRGMVSGMAGFVGFCAAVALLIVPAGTIVAFAAALVAALALQVLVLCVPLLSAVRRRGRRECVLHRA